MKFAVTFEDAEDAMQIRQQFLPDHIAFLQRHGSEVMAAGPLKDDGGEVASGLWIVDANDADRVRALVREDPFWPAGLRKEVRIQQWQEVFADGKTL